MMFFCFLSGNAVWWSHTQNPPKQSQNWFIINSYIAYIYKYLLNSSSRWRIASEFVYITNIPGFFGCNERLTWKVVSLSATPFDDDERLARNTKWIEVWNVDRYFRGFQVLRSNESGGWRSNSCFKIVLVATFSISKPKRIGTICLSLYRNYANEETAKFSIWVLNSGHVFFWGGSRTITSTETVY